MPLPIIFVAHSLGGIVVKDALSLSKQETIHLRDILTATIGVEFLGTPHHGSKTASLGKIAFEMSRLLLQNPNIKILRALEGQSEILNRISKSFAQVLASKEDIKVHLFQEELDTKGMSIVDASSSTIGCGREKRSTLHANHRDMAKYASAEHVNFKRVSSVLRRWVEPLSAPRTSSNQMPAPYNDSDEGPADMSDEEYERLLAAINFPNARSRLETVEAAYNDTYTWVYEDSLGFKAWLQGQDPSPIFWISGKPGSGKSTLMKHVLKKETTGLYLRDFNQAKWLLTGYFFHDRGSDIQKTMEGLLCEILYQILFQRRDLFLFVHQILQDRCAQKALRGSASRDIGDLRHALFTIARNSNSPLNCCIFVDALDEHLGNHRELISFLKDLAHKDWTPNFRLRLCVASRPENIFLDALHDYPGFAIHKHTRADIRRYAEGRFQLEQSVTLDEQQKEITGRLVSQIEAKSDGVFMWARLVVNELVEGLCEGDTLRELEALLSEIPTELSDLYGRAIRRHPQRSMRLVARHRDEAYLMFRIASSAFKPIPLRHLIRATLFLAGEEHASAEADEMSRESMERRLNSRSCGLLEVMDLNYPDKRHVQFVHQTVKEFITSEKGTSIIEEGITLAEEDGDVLIFRYILKRLESSCQWAISQFSLYAGTNQGPDWPEAWIERPMKRVPKSTLISLIYEEFDSGHRQKDETWADMANLYTRDKIVLWLIIYSFSCIGFTLERFVEMNPEIMDADVSVVLLRAALWRSNRDDGGFRAFQTLLKWGVGSHLTARSFYRLDELFKKRLSEETGPHFFTDSYRELRQLWISKTSRFRTESALTAIDEGEAVSEIYRSKS